MAIVLGVNASVNFENYSGLKASLIDFLDARGQERVAEFIGYAEDYLRLHLDATDQEATISGAGAAFAVPNCERIAFVTPVDGRPLRRVAMDVLQSEYATGTVPLAYAEWGETVIIGPTPAGDQKFRVHYVETLRTLSETNQTNWLIKRHPSIYLYAALIHAEAYLRDPSWIDRFWEYVNSSVVAINKRAIKKRSSGVLRPNLGIVP